MNTRLIMIKQIINLITEFVYNLASGITETRIFNLLLIKPCYVP